MASKKVYSWLNPRQSTNKREVKPSCVVPSPVLSIRQIMDRYARGMPLTQQVKNPLWHNGEFPDIQKMDLSEIQELRRSTKEEIIRIQGELKDQEQYQTMLKEESVKKQIADLQAQLNEKNKPVL